MKIDVLGCDFDEIDSFEIHVFSCNLHNSYFTCLLYFTINTYIRVYHEYEYPSLLPYNYHDIHVFIILVFYM